MFVLFFLSPFKENSSLPFPTILLTFIFFPSNIFNTMLNIILINFYQNQKPENPKHAHCPDSVTVQSEKNETLVTPKDCFSLNCVFPQLAISLWCVVPLSPILLHTVSPLNINGFSLNIINFSQKTAIFNPFDSCEEEEHLKGYGDVRTVHGE